MTKLHEKNWMTAMVSSDHVSLNISNSFLSYALQFKTLIHYNHLNYKVLNFIVINMVCA